MRGRQLLISFSFLLKHVPLVVSDDKSVNKLVFNTLNICVQR